MSDTDKSLNKKPKVTSSLNNDIKTASANSKSLNTETVICNFLSSLIYGGDLKKTINKNSPYEDALNTQNSTSLYKLVEEIRNTVVSKSSGSSNAAYKSMSSEVMINHESVMAIGEFAHLSKTDIANAVNNLKTFAMLIQDKNFAKALSSFNTFSANNDNIIKTYKSLAIISESLAKVMAFVSSIQPDKIKNNLRVLNSLFGKDIDSNPFAMLFRSISALSKEITADKNSFYAIESFFDALIKMSSIKFKSRMSMFSTIEFINSFLIDSLGEMFRKFNEITKNLSPKKLKEKEEAVSSFLSDFIESISVDSDMEILSGYDLKQISTVIGKIPDFIKGFDEIDISDEFSNKLDNVQKVFTFIHNSSELVSNYKMINADILDNILEFVDDMHDLIDEINEAKIDEESVKKVNSISDFISGLRFLSNFALEFSFKNLLRGIASIELSKVLLVSLGSFRNMLYKIFGSSSDIDKMISMSEMTGDLLNKIAMIPVIGFEDIKLKELAKSLLIVPELHKIDRMIKAIAEIRSDISEKLLKTEITDKEIKQVTKISEYLNALVKISIAGSLNAVVGKLSKKGLKSLSEEIDDIKSIVSSFSEISNKDLDKAQKTAKLVMAVAGISASILLIGAFVMKAVSVTDILSFTICLSFFLTAVVGVFEEFSKDMKATIETAIGAVMLISVSAAVMLLGAKAYESINTGSVLLFSAFLGLFLLEIGAIFKLFGKSYGEAMKGAKNAMIIVSASAAVLIAGSFLYRKINIGDTILFVVSLGTFLFAIGEVFKLFNLAFRSSMKGAKDAVILVSVSALILVLGAMVVKEHPDLILYSMEFTVMLGIFLITLSGIFVFNSKFVKHALKVSKDFSLLIAVSAGILIIGGLVLKKYPDLWKYITEFGAILAGFVFIVSNAFVFYRHQIRQAKKIAVGMAILTAVSAGVLLIGGGLFMKFPELPVNVMKFAGILAAYVAVMGRITAVLGKAKKNLIAGVLALGSIVAITGLAVLVFEKLNDVAKKTDFDKLDDALIRMGIVIGGISALVGTIAGILYASGGLGAAALAAGEAALASIVGIVWLMAKAFDALAHAAISLDKAKNFDVQGSLNMIKGFGKLIKEMISEFSVKDMLKITAVSVAFSKAGNMLSSLASGIQSWASLKIPVYEENSAKIKSYVNLTDTDFAKASDNIKHTVAVIGSAITEVYDKNPELFKVTFGSFMAGGSKFSVVVKSLSLTGKMLENLAEGIQDWADLRIPVYNPDSVEIKTYIPLTSDHFTKVGENIRRVVTSLGTALIDIYNEDPNNMFKRSFWTGETPFMKVTRSLSTVGSMLTSLAEGVKSWAGLEIPVYYENSTRIKTHMSLGKDDFTLVGKNVSAVVTALGTALVDTMKENPKLFKESWTGWNDSPAIQVAKAIGMIGNILSSIAMTIPYYATGHFPVMSIKNGKIFMSISKENILDDIPKIKEPISIVITALASALIDAMNTKTTAKYYKFSDMMRGNYRTSPAYLASLALLNISKTLSETVTVIGSLADADKFNSIKDKMDSVTSSIKAILTSFVDIIAFLSEVPVDSLGHKHGTGTFSNLDLSEYINRKKSKIKTLTDDLNWMLSSDPKRPGRLQQMLNALSGLGRTLSGMDLSGISENTLKANIVNPIHSMGHIITSLISFSDNFKGISIDDIKEQQSFISAMNAEMNGIAAAISRYIYISNLAASENDVSFNALSIGLSKLMTVTKEFRVNKDFEDHVALMEKYVTSFNSLNLQNVNSITSFIDAVNRLSSKVGNVDKLTSVLAKQITVVLSRLVSEMQSAQNTIQEADKLQVRRQALINNSIKDIKKIMAMPLDVNVTAQTLSSAGGSANSLSTEREDTDGGGNGGSGSPAAQDIKEPQTKEGRREKAANSKHTSSMILKEAMKPENSDKVRIMVWK